MGDGLDTAVDLASEAAGDAPWEGSPVQAVLPLAELVLEEDDGGNVVARRGPGRPLGSRNKRTDELVSYLLRSYAHPLEVLAQTLSRPIDELRAELGCSKLEAMKLVISCAEKLAPYMAQKQPQAIHLGDQDGAPLMALVVSPDIARLKDASAGGRTLIGVAMDPEGDEAGEEESEADQ